MSTLLFRLNGVGEDEANDVRALLDTNDIAYYETDAGRWGISIAALWLNDKAQLEQARTLLDDYQRQRSHRFQTMTESDPDYQKPLSMIERLKQAPVYYLSILTAIAAILYISIVPFLGLA